MWLWLQRDEPILLFAPTPSHCHKCSFCLGGSCEDRLAAEGSAERSLADAPVSHCGLGAVRGAGPGASLENRAALLVGGAPAQQTRHAPARSALPIGRARRPISGAETRGKHRRVHVPFVHSGGGGEVGWRRRRRRRWREAAPGCRLSQTGTGWAASGYSEAGRPTQRVATIRYSFVLFLHSWSVDSTSERKHVVTRDVVTVRRRGRRGGAHMFAHGRLATPSLQCAQCCEDVALYTGCCYPLTMPLCVSFWNNGNSVEVVLPRNAFYCVSRKFFFIITAEKHSGVCVVFYRLLCDWM